MTTATRAIGQSIVPGEGPDKVTGKFIYAADVSLPGMLWDKVLRSPFLHARIVSIDTFQAKVVPDVHVVITAADLPGIALGRRLRDMPVKMLSRNHSDRIRIAFDVTVQTWWGELGESSLIAVSLSVSNGDSPPISALQTLGSPQV